MSKRFLLLADVADHEKLVPAARSLTDLPGVEWWHAVGGHVNLVVYFQGDHDLLLSRLRSKAGNISIHSCECLSDGASFPALSTDHCHAWVFVDAEPAHLNSIRESIESTSGVLCVLTTRGGCDLAALIKGQDSAAIDRTIDEQIRPLDGILRLKQNHIINLTTL